MKWIAYIPAVILPTTAKGTVPIHKHGLRVFLVPTKISQEWKPLSIQNTAEYIIFGILLDFPPNLLVSRIGDQIPK